MLYASANASRSQQAKSSSEGLTREEVMSEDTAQISLRRNDQGSLDALAEETGGFLVANTNDLRSGIERLAADMNTYYEIAYTPQSMLYDGKFHKLSVKITRPNATLQTRSGYFAVPPASASTGPTMPFEVPLLNALNASTPAHSFDYKMAVLHFEHNQKGQHQSLVLELPLSNFTFLEDKARKVYNTRFSVMAVVKDAGGKIVEKMSQNIPLEGALDRLENLKKANFVFLKDFWLPAGEYTLETLAMDLATNKTSATRTKLSIAQPSGSLGLSSILVVKRVDQLTPENQTADDPLNYQGSKIVPFINEIALPSKGGVLPIHLTIYPAAAEKPATLELLFRQGEQLISSATIELKAPDNQGRIPYLATIPLDNFKPGRYELRTVARQGQSETEESIFFTIN
jgi:hypothetical protein